MLIQIRCNIQKLALQFVKNSKLLQYSAALQACAVPDPAGRKRSGLRNGRSLVVQADRSAAAVNLRIQGAEHFQNTRIHLRDRQERRKLHIQLLVSDGQGHDHILTGLHCGAPSRTSARSVRRICSGVLLRTIQSSVSSSPGSSRSSISESYTRQRLSSVRVCKWTVFTQQ